MKIEQWIFTLAYGWNFDEYDKTNFDPQVVLCFIAEKLLTNTEALNSLQSRYLNADIVYVSTAWEIFDETMHEESISVVAIEFEKTPIKLSYKAVENRNNSFKIGTEIVQELAADDLQHIMLFSEWLNVSGMELVRGIETGKSIWITGGLAWDDGAFEHTCVWLNEVCPEKSMVLWIGFYGENIQIGRWSIGWWDAFGQKRIVTKAKDNVIYELDNEPILDLYKKYLWDLAAELPSSGLLFPLEITPPDSKESFVRTLLAVNEEEKSVSFAGDVVEGSTAELMKANFDRLIDGAGKAAEMWAEFVKHPELAILISCVGRKLILKQRTEEELEIIKEVIGDETKIAWFYSYGEIGPNETDMSQCNLHNQTMTLTFFKENLNNA